MGHNGLRLRFLLLFVAGVSLFAAIFSKWQALFDQIYLYPVSYAAATLLDRIGIPAELNASSLSLGFCLVIFDEIIFRVIPECTGIFALLIFLAALLAYPASAAQKGWGLLLGLPAFFVYSSLRLVLLGVVAHLHSEWLPFFHVYLMLLLNLGFMLCVWVSWINRGVSHD